MRVDGEYRGGKGIGQRKQVGTWGLKPFGPEIYYD